MAGAMTHAACKVCHVCLSALIASSLVAGCGRFLIPVFARGTYSGDLACTAHAVEASGATADDSFSSPTTLSIDSGGMFSVDGVEMVVGGQVVRSIPTADLAFEITKISRLGPLLKVEYVPRPTLPGVSVDGKLVETYRWAAGAVLASAESDLAVTDASGATTFTITCQGPLAAQ